MIVVKVDVVLVVVVVDVSVSVVVVVVVVVDTQSKKCPAMYDSTIAFSVMTAARAISTGRDG